MKAHSKTIVVGAGAGGIATALLAALRGESVTLIESHSALGGCASWFRRGKFVFDAGATTVSGVGTGEPLAELFELIGNRPKLFPCDPGIVFHLSNGKILRYHQDFERWLEELAHHFPELNHRPFWSLVRELNQESWNLLRDVRTFPFRSLRDLEDVLKHPRYIKLVPYLFISTDQMLKKFGLDRPDLRELVDGILIISAQAKAQNIPFIVGAMALAYPAATFAPVGGMKGLMDFFEAELSKKGVEIRKKTKVTSFTKSSIKTSDGEALQGDRIILNLPIWNLAELAEGEVRKQFVGEAGKNPGSWGAFTLYFGCKSSVSDLYQQIHLRTDEVDSYFVSFSHPEDRLRAPEGYQSVAISTHVYADDDCDRHKLTRIIMEDFEKRFLVSDIRFLTSGTPKTFERYTGRKNGYVGGLPFLYGKNPLGILAPVTKEKTIFRVGDTVFPGQGIVGVVTGALQLHHRFKRGL